MKRSFEFSLDACIGNYTTKRPATVVAVIPKRVLPPPPPPPIQDPDPTTRSLGLDEFPAPEAQSAAQKMLHELINGGGGDGFPPLLTPLAALQPQAQAPPLPVLAPEAPLDPHRHKHAGIFREFGGVREWLKTRDAYDAAATS